MNDQIKEIEEKLGKLLEERDAINAELNELEKQKHIRISDIERIAEQIESFRARRRELEPQLETAREELVNAGKIIRPAYKNVQDRRAYVPLSERT